jgi:hypothetical protein
MQACNNEKVFHHYKKREVQMDAEDLKPKPDEPQSFRSYDSKNTPRYL